MTIVGGVMYKVNDPDIQHLQVGSRPHDLQDLFVIVYDPRLYRRSHMWEYECRGCQTLRLLTNVLGQ